MPSRALSSQEIDTLGRHLGPAILRALGDPDVTEISVNDDLVIWVDGPAGYVRAEDVYSGLPARASAEGLNKFGRLIAAQLDEVLTGTSPSLSAELAWTDLDLRLQIFRPPITAEHHTLILRKLAARFYPLAGTPDAYLERGILDEAQLQTIRAAIDERLNILVVGGMASGKTTFANALLGEISERTPSHRVILLQDTRELRCMAPNFLDLRTTPSVSLRDLTKMALRTGGDRVVVGEIRDEAALDLLDIWLTGHTGGLATFHADSAQVALRRLDGLCRRLSASSQAETIAEAVGLVVVLKKAPPPLRRRVVSVQRVVGWKEGRFLLGSGDS